VLVGLVAATIAIDDAQNAWPGHGDPATQAEINAFYPPLYSSTWARWLGRIASWGTTLILMVFWLFALRFGGLLLGGIRFGPP
jgi:hypothetical protein